MPFAERFALVMAVLAVLACVFDGDPWARMADWKSAAMQRWRQRRRRGL